MRNPRRGCWKTLIGAGYITFLSACGGATADAAGDTTTGNPPPAADAFFTERFADSNLGSRGWYDIPTSGNTSISTVEHPTGVATSLAIVFPAGATVPQPRAGGRHSFPESESVYIGYWVKYSDNWVGSGQPYHPHELYVMTNLDDPYVGPANTFLTTYVEDNTKAGAVYGVLGIQDAKNIDVSRINQDLTNVTENRAVAGCNGSFDEVPSDCYKVDATYLNGKTWKSAAPAFTAQSGSSSYKGTWHHVEAYFQLNSIKSGRGQPDGLAQYWVDGSLLIDRRNVVYRTAAHPSLKFNQLLLGPYIGDGSPVAQTMWMANLVVAARRPSS